MATTYTVTQSAECFASSIDTSITTNIRTNPQFSSCAIFRFAIPNSSSVYFMRSAQLTMTISGTISGPSERYKVAMLKDPTTYSTLVTGAVPVSTIPDNIDALYTAPSYLIATTTITSYGSPLVFNLDLATINNIMCSSISASKVWNGSLVFWVQGLQYNDLNGVSAPSLVVDDTVNYTNRDTGSPGINSSRWDRCPVTGLKIPRENLVLDGYRKTLIHPDDWDPEEPESYEWSDFEEPNEGN